MMFQTQIKKRKMMTSLMILAKRKILDKSGQVWTSLDKSGQVWKNMNKHTAHQITQR
jgi:plasmid maintenance system antidote protein VapI